MDDSGTTKKKKGELDGQGKDNARPPNFLPAARPLCPRACLPPSARLKRAAKLLTNRPAPTPRPPTELDGQGKGKGAGSIGGEEDGSSGDSGESSSSSGDCDEDGSSGDSGEDAEGEGDGRAEGE